MLQVASGYAWLPLAVGVVLLGRAIHRAPVRARTVWAVAGLVAAGLITWTHVRFGDPVLSWQTLLTVGAVALFVALSEPGGRRGRDERAAGA